MEEVIIEDENSFEKLKQAIKQAGKEKFHVVADFDRTLTYAFYGDKRAGSIISRLRDGRYLTKDYAGKARVLFEKYHLIETDADVGMIEKSAKMKEWWEKHFELLIECGLDKPTIVKVVDDMIKEKSLKLRKGVIEFLRFLRENKIPLVIISSSVGDIISEFLKKTGVLYENVHIFANLLEFEGEKAVGIKKVIHVFNKNEIEVDAGLGDRRNALLLGDSLGDLGMVGEEADKVIRIGFLNENVENNLGLFKENFDVVLTGDGDFDFVNKLIKELIV